MNKEHPTAEVDAPLMAHDPLNTFLEDGMMDKDSGADPAFVASPSSQQVVSTEGFNPGDEE